MHHPILAMNRAPRCGARTRSGKPCQSPVVRGKRGCRMHGGARGSGAPLGNRNSLRHGRYSSKAIARKRAIMALLRAARQLVEIGITGNVPGGALSRRSPAPAARTSYSNLPGLSLRA
jgi:hypothetical protein